MKKYTIKELTVDSILLSLTIVLTITPWGYPTFGPISATIIHIPILIAVIYYKKLSKAILYGLIFGISSFAINWLKPITPLSIAFQNPLVSVFPRVIMAMVAYKISKFKSNYVAAFLGTLTNSVLVLTMIGLLYTPIIKEIGMTFVSLVTLIMSTSFIVEAGLAVLIVPRVVKIVGK